MLPIEIENKRLDIQAQVQNLGAKLVDLRVHRSGQRRVITIIADKDGGITLDECAKINHALGVYFDDLSQQEGQSGGFFSNRYFIEVNSPGLDRLLKSHSDFVSVQGKKIRLIYREDSGRIVEYRGVVENVTTDTFELKLESGQTAPSFKIESVVKAVREISFKNNE